MTSETTRPSLLARLRDPADREAWRQFESKYRELIIRYCRGRGLSHTDAEDVCQIVMLKLSRGLDKFEYSPERGRFRGFLGRIVRNEVIRHVHRSLPNGHLRDDALARLAAPPEPQTPDAVWESEWMHHHLRLAIRHVRDTGGDRATAVFEQILAGETVSQIAAAFQMTADAVYKVKQRMRDRIKARVAAQIAEEDDPGG